VLLDRYEILDEIGQGGMQQVYLAKDLSLKREVALKVPINVSAQKRFERSAKLSATIVHPNIAKTLDYANSGELEFLVEELIPGNDLQQRLDRDFTLLDPHLTAHLIHHLAKAVSAMNVQGIIHRDLKPSNIMVSSDMGMLDMKVTDFGVATMAAAEIKEAVKGGQDSIAASKTVVGALAFMAPELIKRSDGVDRSKCDAWSIGALLYFLLFGEYPFGNELAAIQNILNGTYKDQTAHVISSKLQFRGLTRSLWEISKRCLSMSVEDRPSATEIANLFSKVTYSGAPRQLGRIKYLNPRHGTWGFISPDDGANDIFFHFDSFFGGKPTNGLRVMYSAYPGEPQARAFPVVPCKAPSDA
jgi:serine/threonine-protein kinase